MWDFATIIYILIITKEKHVSLQHLMRLYNTYNFFYKISLYVLYIQTKCYTYFCSVDAHNSYSYVLLTRGIKFAYTVP